MSKITFITPVALDPRDIVLFGASQKPGLHFGTGFKYSLAIFARLGIQCEVQVCEGGIIHRSELSVQTTDYRGKPIQVLRLGDRELPFTTNLGRNWHLWQAVRELVANTKEENGSIFFDDEYAHYSLPADQYTRIDIEGPELEELIDVWDFFYLPNAPALAMINNIEILQPADGAAGALYCKGYLISDSPVSSPLRYSYNFLGEVALTEDRTAANAYALYLTAQAQLFGAEHNWIDESLAFTDVYAESNYDGFQNNLQIWEDWLEDRYEKLFPELRAKFNDHRRQATSTFQEFEMQPWMQKQLDKISRRFHLSEWEITPANSSFASCSGKQVYLEFAPDLFTTALRLFKSLINNGCLRTADYLAEYLLCPQEILGAGLAPDGTLLPHVKINHAPAIAMDTGSLTESEAGTVCSEHHADIESAILSPMTMHPDFINLDFEHKADAKRDRHEADTRRLDADLDDDVF